MEQKRGAECESMLGFERRRIFWPRIPLVAYRRQGRLTKFVGAMAEALVVTDALKLFQTKAHLSALWKEKVRLKIDNHRKPEGNFLRYDPKKLVRSVGIVILTILSAGLYWGFLKIRGIRLRRKQAPAAFDEKFTWSEAWILTAIAIASYKEGHAQLDRILAMCDAIQHAIPNYGELDAALWRLTQARHVIRDGQNYRCSKAVRAAYEHLKTVCEKPALIQEGLRDFIQAPEWSPVYRPPLDSRGYLITRWNYEWALRTHKYASRAQMREAITRQLAEIQQNKH